MREGSSIDGEYSFETLQSPQSEIPPPVAVCIVLALLSLTKNPRQALGIVKPSERPIPGWWTASRRNCETGHSSGAASSVTCERYRMPAATFSCK